VGRARAAACAAVLVLGCADATRYVVVTDASVAREQDAAERRLVCVAPSDARANPGLLGLRTRASVREYGETRRGDGGALEAVLFQLVSGEYARAAEALRDRGDEVPEYLRRLLAADLASETSPPIRAAALLDLYQAAYDVQESEAGRRIVELRIRQLRYGR
jgi:hypothetical protein